MIQHQFFCVYFYCIDIYMLLFVIIVVIVSEITYFAYYNIY